MYRVVTLLAICLWATTASAQDWVDQRAIGIYVFRSEFPLTDIAPLVVELGELQKDVESTLNLKCSDRKIEVHLFSSRWRFNRYIQANVPEGAGRQAVFVAGTEVGKVYAYRHRDFETDMRHEMTHALLHNALPYVPLWLDEGLAEYFEVPTAIRAEKRTRQDGLLGLLNRRIASLAELEAKRKLAEFSAAEYRDARCWVHFLLHGPPEAHAALEEFLATIPTGREPTPISVSLQRRMPDVEQRFQTHFR